MDGFGAEFFGDLWGEGAGEELGVVHEAHGGALGQIHDLCGLHNAKPLTDITAASGLVVTIDGMTFDLGDGVADGGSVTLADDRGLSIYADVDGDGAVDHVTTVLYDGSWQTWSAQDAAPMPDEVGQIPEEAAHGSAHHTNEGENQNVTDSTSASVRHWDAFAWEQEGRGKWL